MFERIFKVALLLVLFAAVLLAIVIYVFSEPLDEVELEQPTPQIVIREAGVTYDQLFAFFHPLEESV